METEELSQELSQERASAPGFTRLKKPMIQRMAKRANIRHVSTLLADDMRDALYRYLKAQAPKFVLSNGGLQEEKAHDFVIPAKTFAFLVRMAADNNQQKWLPEDLLGFHVQVEAWWYELFVRSKRIADHREHSVVQWKDIELVLEMAKELP